VPDRSSRSDAGVTAEPGALAPLLGELITAHRELRYRWAASVTPSGARVLDAGCSTGEGAALLAATGAGVVAVDRPSLIEIARTRVPASVEFQAGSLEELPVADGSFDVVVCVGGFDTGDAFDPKAVVDELIRVAAPEGLLVVAPVAARDNAGVDFDAADLADLFSAAGFHVRTYAQDTWLYAAMHAGLIPLMVDRPEPLSEPSLVLASKAALPEPDALVGAVTDLGVTRLHELQADLGRELSRAHELLVRAERQQEEIDEIAAQLTAAEQEHALMLDLEGRLAETIAERDTLRAELESMRNSAAWRVTAPLRWLAARR
jgi:ubiquinone/menaquinone biosynthesis C-methylase UbiE